MIRGIILFAAMIIVGIVIISGFLNGFAFETVLLRGGLVVLFFSLWGVLIAISVASIKSELDRKEMERLIEIKRIHDEEKKAKRKDKSDKFKELASRY